MRTTLRELEAKGGALEGVGIEHVARHLGAEGCALRKLALPGVPYVRGALGQLADGLSTNRRLEVARQLQPGTRGSNPAPPAPLAITLTLTLTLDRAARWDSSQTKTA